MLNTKSIKKSHNIYDNKIPNLSSDIKVNINQSDKIVNIESSKQKELENMVKQVNHENMNKLKENLNNDSNEYLGGNNLNKNFDNYETLLDTDNKIKNPIVNKEFTNDIYKDTILNISNIIDGNKILNNSGGNNSIDNLDYNLKINKEMNQLNNNQNEKNKVEWDNDENSYIIYNDNNIECRLTNENILKSLLNKEFNDIYIKKYIFITSWNSQIENFEFNFINSSFTNNLDIMIKVQNFIYDTLMNFDNLNVSDTYNYHDTIMIFYFQLIIFLFNNYNLYLISANKNKISKIYSSLSYRFSSLVLKNILKIKNNIDENNELLNKLIYIRSDLLSKISYINDKIKINNFSNISKNEHSSSNQILSNEIISFIKNSDILDNTQLDLSNISDESDCFNNQNINIESNESKSNETKSNESKSDLDSELYNSISSKNSRIYKIMNSQKINISSNENTYSIDDNKIEKMNIKNKYGNVVKNIKDIFSDDIKINTDTSNNENFDSDKNGYFEINDTISGYSKLSNIDNYKKINPIENSFQSNRKSVSNKDLSYNPNSAILNGKIYKINI
jgi:hypothetical protein